MADPKAVLGEFGMNVPDGIAVNVVENNDSTVHITLPAAPQEFAELSDEELSSAWGGLAGVPLVILIPSPPTLASPSSPQ